MTPALSAIWPAVPVSINTSLAPVLTSKAVKLTGSTRGGKNAAVSAAFTALPSALRMNRSSIGRYQMPS